MIYKEIAFEGIQNIHFLNDIFICLYPYIMNPIFDIYIVVYAFLTVLSWTILKGECILSYFEKKLENIGYELGKDPYYNPYHKKFYYFNGVNYAFIKEMFWIITFIMILCYRKNPIFVKYILIVMLIVVFYLKIPILISNTK
uniref:Uncharacterized protein n=1 Tax=viral metagenome TaxID=1070528 RepID=A0A6C0E5A9_9ZZZZ